MNFIDDLKARGLFHQCTNEEGLKKAFETPEKPVQAYIGFDPTADSLHVGHLAQIMMLKRLALAGHQPLALVGSVTASIGDPSGKSSERNMISQAEVSLNTAKITSQILNLTRGCVVYFGNNQDWLPYVNLVDFLRRIGKHFSVNAMVQRDSVKNRLEQRERGISYTEFSYMLLQAYDFLTLHERTGCTLQVGGSDQWGNIVSGVDLVRRVHEKDVFGLTIPLLTRANGQKFGKTEDGAVWLDPERTPPYEFYQFFYNTPDNEVEGLLRKLTLLPIDTIESIVREGLEKPALRYAQRQLARTLTGYVHGESAVITAEIAAEVLFGTRSPHDLSVQTQHEIFRAIPFVEIGSGTIKLLDAVVQAGLFPTKAEAVSAIRSGGVMMNKLVVKDPRIILGEEHVLQSGHIILTRGKKTHKAVRFREEPS